MAPLARDPVTEEVLAVLRAALPYLLDSARRHERMGLEEEAAAARALHGRATWAIRAAGAGPPRPIEYED